MTKRKAHVITISSLKGGVGKTTLTLWLAGIYAYMGKKVLIMDMDIYTGAIALSLNLKCKKDFYTLNEALNNRSIKNIESHVTKYQDNIDVLASPNDPRLASKISSSYVGTIIERLRSLYDIILIDTNHILTDINIVLLDYTDQVLYLVTPDIACLRNMRSMIYIYKQMKKNPKVELCAVISEDRWIRVSGEAVFDERAEAKRQMLEENPRLKKIYNENDKIFEVFYLKNMSAKIHSLYTSPETVC